MKRSGRSSLPATIALFLASIGAVGCIARPLDPPPPKPIPLHVHFAGTVRCNAFPYGCFATLTVVGPDDPVDAVRSSPADTRWVAADVGATMFDSTPIGGAPAVTPGKHRLVMSVLGAYDVASYDANGELAHDLVSRCSAEVDAKDKVGAIDVLVTFVPDPTGMTYEASCSIDATRR